MCLGVGVIHQINIATPIRLIVECMIGAGLYYATALKMKDEFIFDINNAVMKKIRG